MKCSQDKETYLGSAGNQALMDWPFMAFEVNTLFLLTIDVEAILGLLLVILGFQTFCFTLLMGMAKRVNSTSRR